MDNKYMGTKTFENLKNAFGFESQARNKYTWYAQECRKAGFEQMAELFEETARQEASHAKLWFKAMDGIGSVDHNLVSSIDGEHSEVHHIYPDMAKQAREDGFEDLARKFELVAQAESMHEARFKKLLERYQQDTTFKGDAPHGWKCRNCGYVASGKDAPMVCPVCGHPLAFFERKAENY